MNYPKCPSAELIDQYLIGQLSDQDILQIETHFDECQACSDTIRGLGEGENDTLINELQALVASQVNASSSHGGTIDSTFQTDEPLIQSLVQHLQAESPLDLASRSRTKEERAAEVLWSLGSSDQDDDLGSLGHYRLVELLGAGSTGVVFSAVDTRLNREVALKILRPSLGETARERFLKEAQAAAGFQHDNIVTVFDVGQEAGMVYMTMQLLPGETLEDRLARVTFLNEPEIRKIARQISYALQAAHARGIIHRDLKPANIWIDTERDQIKLLDFGLARVADADPHLTASGILAGTPNFMSPEQSRGLELDGRSDLFSLGCLLYRCITGRLPFNSTGILSTLQAIQHDHPIAPSILNPACSTDLSALIMALLEKQPDSRPASAIDVIDALNSPLEKWRFKTTDFPSQLAEPSVSDRRSNRIPWRPFIVAGIAAMLGWFGWMFGTDIVRIVTNQGEITIESDDKQIKIEVIQNGDVVRVIDLSTSDRIELKAGEYHIQPGREGGKFTVSPNVISLSRGGKQVVRVTKSDRAALPSDPAREGTEPRFQQLVDKPNALAHAKGIIQLETNPPLDLAKDLERTIAYNIKDFEQRYGIRWHEFKPWVERLQEDDLNARLNLRRIAEVTDNNPLHQQTIDSLKGHVDPDAGSIPNDDNEESRHRKNLMQPSSDSLTSSESAPEQTYNGRTFAQWLEIVRINDSANMTNDSGNMLSEGIQALGHLSLSSSHQQTVAIETVTALLRKMPLDQPNQVQQLNQIRPAVVNFFENLEPADTSAFIREELQNGTPASRSFLSGVSSSPLTDRDEKLKSQFETDSIMTTWIAKIEQLAKQDDDDAIGELGAVAKQCNYWLRPDPNRRYYKVNTREVKILSKNPVVIEQVQAALKRATNPASRMVFAECLIRMNCLDQPSLEVVREKLFSPQLELLEQRELILLLMDYSSSNRNLIFPTILELAQRLSENDAVRSLKPDDLVDEPSRHLSMRPSTYFGIVASIQVGLTLSNRFLLIDEGSGAPRGKANSWVSIQVPDDVALRLSLIRLMSSFRDIPAEIAAPAVEWLKSQIREVDSDQFTQSETRALLRTNRLNEDQRDNFVQLVFNEEIEAAIKALQTLDTED
jgi:serine/threonine protein kinase